MMYAFDDCELDTAKVELRRHGSAVAVEPQVFNLLKLLVECRDRAVSKDEIIAHVWNGRIVSDGAVASRVRLARKAVGDDGTRQGCIRTVHGYGFRFVADVSVLLDAAPSDERASEETGRSAADRPDEDGTRGTRPSIAVLPFRSMGPASEHDVLADGLPHDLIQSLARLRWLLVIARGSSFRFRAECQDVREIGKKLGVRYCLVGSIEASGRAMVVTIELSDTHDGVVIWGDQFRTSVDNVHDVRAEIVMHVVTALEIQIPLHEAQVARLSASENLDAWSNYHLGLQHMFRFTQRDNARATGYFERAVAQDPGFARAYAGLSFTHFQDAFVKYSGAPDEAMRNARRFAERGLEFDPMDPFANLTMGRYFWLEGGLENSFEWLDRALRLSPNYAQCIYSRAFSDLLSGNSGIARKEVDQSLLLSPLDPLRYGMLGVRALSYVAEGDFEAAAKWGEKAARAPGAHYLIGMIAAVAHSLNGDEGKVRHWIAEIRRRRPDACRSQFFDSFPFSDATTRTLISGAFRRYGL